MRAGIRMIVSVSVIALGMGVARAEEAAPVQPAMTPEQQAAMEAMQKLGSPGEGHKALEALVGEWAYTAEFRMSPEAPVDSMTGQAVNTLILGGRFLQQQVKGQADGWPPFEGLGFIGYDNLRQEYQTVWLDNMGTTMMKGRGQFDAATKTLTDEGDFSCAMTGEPHRWYRSAWKVVDADHAVYESYFKTPDGREYKAMELQYTRTAAPCDPGMERC